MIRAMIFDLDGTLVQTEKLKALSYAKAARMLRPELKEDVVVDGGMEVVEGRSDIVSENQTGEHGDSPPLIVVPLSFVCRYRSKICRECAESDALDATEQ